ncbi:hypothetical protein HJG60_011095 [Phyllostomus discolor]|uniref:Uncharacterized protein n=1 Tax=Phyllostomus discolor TaxID=89673 RepID=A0A834E536_9CHIR|nr:hypothetical protein HJG60_011095 [Phyllostomus discolor]
MPTMRPVIAAGLQTKPCSEDRLPAGAWSSRFQVTNNGSFNLACCPTPRGNRSSPSRPGPARPAGTIRGAEHSSLGPGDRGVPLERPLSQAGRQPLPTWDCHVHRHTLMSSIPPTCLGAQHQPLGPPGEVGG